MATPSFLFGGNTGLTQEQISTRRKVLDAMAMREMGTAPKNVGEGLARLGQAIAYRMQMKRLDEGEAANAKEEDAIMAPILAGFDGKSATAGAGGASASAGSAPAADVSGLTDNDVYNSFMKTVEAGGLKNPYGLAAVAATGKAESGFSPGNVNRTWSDPSQSGQAGTAGGIMSWRGPRYQALAAAGDLSPEGQAKFFLNEDRGLIQSLNGAKSVEDAQRMMNNAWKFAGYDQPGGEAARRLAAANALLPSFRSAQAPNLVASLDASIGMPEAAAAIDSTAPGSGTVDPSTMSALPMNGPVPTSRPAVAAVAGALGNRPQGGAAAPAPTTVAQSGPSMSYLYGALMSPKLSEAKRTVVGALIERRQREEQAAQAEQAWRARQEYERDQQQNDPGYQLEQEYKRAQVDALKGKKEKNWQKLDDGTLFDPETGETKSVGRQGAAPGGFRYAGNSVEAQSLNGLMDSGAITPAEAQQIGAGKTITGPNGEIIFMTPQGVFSQQQGGRPAPVVPAGSPPGSGAQPSMQTAPVPSGSPATGAPVASGLPSPTAGMTAAPTQPGMIPLTAPKPQNTQIPAEMGARIGMGDAFLKELPNIRQQIQNGDASGPIDGAMLGLGIGTPAAIWRNIETGRDALVRNLTGAGMSESEAKNQTARYQISPTDSQETMLSKLDNLQRDLLATRDGAIKARTGNLGEPPKAEGDPLAAARQAIAKGAPREAVIQRLRQNGINPEGL